MQSRTYEITFVGQAGTTLRGEFDDCEVSVSPGTTTLRAELPDQGALQGLMLRIRGRAGMASKGDDVAALARHAVDGGADLLGVAGGDGTQALVASIAAGRDVPTMVISAGTRNHFALDLGLDRDDPAACLDALTDGVELRIDLALIGDRTFVNNVSFDPGAPEETP